MKRLLVLALVRGCEVSHRLPMALRARMPGPVCPLAHLSWWLDDRWATGVWDGTP